MDSFTLDILKGLPPVGAPIHRMSIDHPNGGYLVEGEPLPHHEVIMLGAILRRVMFPPRSCDGSGSLECSSNDGESGQPTYVFPTPESNFSNDFIEGAIKGKDKLVCSACVFKEWSSDGPKKVHPRCTVQVTVPMLIHTDKHDRTLSLASMSYQRSAEKPIREYLRGFTKGGRPAYSNSTRLSLNVNLGNGFKYSTPAFIEGRFIDTEIHPALSALYRHAREVLTAPPALPQSKVEAVGGMLSVVTAPPSEPVYTGRFFG